MSWRRFLELLTGLSGESRFAALMADRAERNAKRHTFATQAEAQAYAASGYGMRSA